jgi:hypothetical protein
MTEPRLRRLPITVAQSDPSEPITELPTGLEHSLLLGPRQATRKQIREVTLIDVVLYEDLSDPSQSRDLSNQNPGTPSIPYDIGEERKSVSRALFGTQETQFDLDPPEIL